MAEQIISPGVFSNESDKSLYTQGPQTVGAAIIGPTAKGTPMVPTSVTSYSDYLSKFGDVFLPSGSSTYQEYFTSLAVREYFGGGGQTMLVTRIISGSGYTTFASADIGSAATVGTGYATGSSAVTTTFMTSSNQEVRITYGSTVYRFIASAPSPIPADDIDGNLYYFVTGSTATVGINNLTGSINRALSGSAASASVDLVYATSNGTTTLILSGSLMGTYANGITLSTGSGTSFSTLITLGNGTSTSVNSSSFTLETLTWGNIMNNTSSIIAGSSDALQSGSIDNVRWEISNVNTSSGNFDLLIRRGDDNTSNKNVLETWSNLSLDPQQANYISRVIGDQKITYGGSSNPILQYQGNYPVTSQYVRVKPNTVNNIVNSIDSLGNFKSTNISLLPAIGSGSYKGSFAGGLAATDRASTFFENINSAATDCQGYKVDDYAAALTLLTNKDEFNFNLLLVPGATLGAGPLSSISDDTIALCEGRTDSMAIVDATPCGVTGSAQTPAAAVTAATTSTSNYAATYYPWVQVYSSNLGKAVWVPPSVVMGGVYAFNDQVAAEWFAPAGLNRGGIGSVIRAERKLSQADRDVLYAGNVNPLATFPGNGVVAFGQKTLQKRSTALDRVNVRRLLITLKRFLGGVGRNLIFEQNTSATRNRFLAVAEPYMESVVQRQGLYSYKIVMDESNNTPDVIDRNQLVGQIYIQPTKTAEFIILNFTVTPTGATF
jgi:phage tail sheath protein FI